MEEKKVVKIPNLMNDLLEIREDLHMSEYKDALVKVNELIKKLENQNE